MKKFTYYLWMIIYLTIHSVNVTAQVFDSKTTLYTTNNGFQDWYTESVYSPLESHEGNLYFVMLDNNRRPIMGKIVGGSTTTYPLDDINVSYKPHDDGHHEFSIGIDKDGYIHVTGDMHNYPQAFTSHIPSSYNGSNIMYWKSSVPGDITSMEFVGNTSETIPGEAWGYGHFITDRNGELYYSSRTLARTYYYQKGSDGGAGRGLGLYSYNTASKTWIAHGTQCSASDASFPVIAWEESGQGGGSYQQFKSDIWFDTDNRMHLVSGMNTQNKGAQVNSIIYAYSDDGGLTFHRADGSNITLPMRVAPGAQQADVIFSNPEASNQQIEQPTVTAAWNNYPVVQYRNTSGYYKYWNGTSWSSAQSSPINMRDKILFNEHTEQLLFIDIHSGNIYAKTSPTSSNETYDAGETFRYFDIKTFRTQNVLNGISWKADIGKFEVIQLAGPVVTPTDCNGEVGGTASVDDCGECSGGSTGIAVNSTCSQDCNGEWGGTATLDDCSVCSGGSTGVVPCDQDPYNGTPHAIPGVIEVEEYDLGANTIAYNDLTAGNTGGEFRTDDVDIEISTNGGYNVGWTQTGEWLEYTVDVDQTTDYEFSIEGATEQSGIVHLELNGVTISGVITISTGGWQTWNTVVASNPISLSTGEQILRLVIDQGPLNIEKMEFKIILPNDCAGVAGGSATIDGCGICSGGNTGITPSSPTLWYEDADNDGLGDPEVSVSDCNQPTGYVSNANDQCPNDNTNTCNDPVDCNGDVNGTASIDACGVCSGGNTGVVASSPSLWYEDLDNDGLGDPAVSVSDCNQPTGYVSNTNDQCPNDNTNTCNDPVDCNGDVNGTASIDVCGVCSGGNTGVVASSPSLWYEDADNDGLGDPAVSVSDCNQPTGYVSNANDQCPNDNTNTCNDPVDCNGDVNGSAEVDQCSVCSGGNTGIPVDDCLTSADDILEKQALVLYPNPTHGIINLSDATHWVLYNAVGQLLQVGDSNKIDLSDYQDGLYFVEVQHYRSKVLKN